MLHAQVKHDRANGAEQECRKVDVLLAENLLHQDHDRMTQGLHDEHHYERQQANERRSVKCIP